jgi:hypothetical protein
MKRLAIGMTAVGALVLMIAQSASAHDTRNLRGIEANRWSGNALHNGRLAHSDFHIQPYPRHPGHGRPVYSRPVHRGRPVYGRPVHPGRPIYGRPVHGVPVYGRPVMPRPVVPVYPAPVLVHPRPGLGFSTPNFDLWIGR